MSDCIPTSADAQAFGYTCKNGDPEHMKVCPDFAPLNAMVARRQMQIDPCITCHHVYGRGEYHAAERDAKGIPHSICPCTTPA